MIDINAVICESFEPNNSNGGYNLIGTFNLVTPPSLPFVKHSFSLVAWIEFPQMLPGDKHLVHAELIDPDGRVMCVTNSYPVAPIPHISRTSMTLLQDFLSLSFQVEGPHPIRIYVDGKVEKELYLRVQLQQS